MNNNFLISMAVLVVLARFAFAFAIYFRTKNIAKGSRIFYTVLALLFPIIIGIVVFAETGNQKNSAKSLVLFILSVIMFMSGIGVGIGSYIDSKRTTYDQMGDRHFNETDMCFYDKLGRKYTYDFDKTGFDFLYCKGKKYNTDLCFLDEKGYIHYDKDMSITVKDSHSCADTNGKLYYPVEYSDFTSDGKIKFSVDIDVCDFDRFGNAYTYERVPIYNRKGEKYYYFFDSLTQVGTYTNLKTHKQYDNKYSFVDDDGYFVFDEKHEFKKDESTENIYTDSDGNKYHWASGVKWTKDGKLKDI